MLDDRSKQEQSIVTYINDVLSNSQNNLQFGQLSDGITFAKILKLAQGFTFDFGELNDKVYNWNQKLKNLRTIVKKIETYFDARIHKGIKTKDLNLVSIAYNQNHPEISKFFEIVLAVMIEAPNKEDHISKIMKLDENSQTVFVQMIQKIIEERILPANETKQQKYQHILYELETENILLRQEIGSLQLQKDIDCRELDELKMAIQKSSGDFEALVKTMEVDSDEWSTNALIQNQNLKNTIDNLKKQLQNNTSEYQIQIIKLKDEIHEKDKKIMKLSSIEDVAQIYKEKYHESARLALSGQNWQKQRIKLMKIVEERDSLIKKLQEKVDHLVQQNFAFQQRQFYLQFQLEKRQARFQELQKEVKKRLKTNESLFNLTPDKINQKAQDIEQISHIQQLEEQVSKLKLKQKESIREKTQLRRTTEKHKNLTTEKKKLQKIILSISKEKIDEIEMLLSIVFDLNMQISTYKKLLIEHGIKLE